MILPLVNTFVPPYEKWSKRQPTQQENLDYHQRNGHLLPYINDRLEEIVSTSLEAACYMARNGADNALEKYIDEQLLPSGCKNGLLYNAENRDNSIACRMRSMVGFRVRRE